MTCCDTCPYTPTCEELEPPDWGEEYPESVLGPDPGDFEWGDDA